MAKGIKNISTLDEIQKKFPRKPKKRYLNKTFKQGLSNPDIFNNSFWNSNDGEHECDNQEHKCDIRKVDSFFNFLRNKSRDVRNLQRKVKESLQDLISNLPGGMLDVKELRVYLMLPFCGYFKDFDCAATITVPFADAMERLHPDCQDTIGEWFKILSLPYFSRCVKHLMRVIRHFVSKWMAPSKKRTIKSNLESLLCLVEKLYKINEEREEKLSHASFHVPEAWFDGTPNWPNSEFSECYAFHLLDFPFIYNAESKCRLLTLHNNIEQILYGFETSLELEVDRDAIIEDTRNQLEQLQDLDGNLAVVGITNLYGFETSLELEVDRDTIIEDTRNQLEQFQDLDGNLAVEGITVRFRGEKDYGPGPVRVLEMKGNVGEDAKHIMISCLMHFGEFFTLFFHQLCQPSLGLFSSQGRGSMWFLQTKKEKDLQLFFFSGFVLGLAVRSSSPVDLKFPTALYKKLLGRPVDLSDFHEVDPAFASSLKALLDNEGAEHAYLTFEVPVYQKDNDGPLTVELCENGSSKDVTDENKHEYVERIVDFHLNTGIEDEFENFNAGFQAAFDVTILDELLFQPSDLLRFIVGTEKLDFTLLEKSAVYLNGYSEDSVTIQIFWKIIHAMSEEDGKRFLRFVTGSETMPQTGLKIEIERMLATGDEETEDLMPEAVTCITRLFLPDIPREERLKDRLLTALNSSFAFTLHNELYNWRSNEL